VQELVDHITQCCASEKAVNIGAAMFTTSLNILSNIVFSKDFSQSFSMSSEEFKDAMWGVMEVGGNRCCLIGDDGIDVKVSVQRKLRGIQLIPFKMEHHWEENLSLRPMLLVQGQMGELSSTIRHYEASDDAKHSVFC
nr:cytochrome P450 [Tanacetum cinerariifolium]